MRTLPGNRRRVLNMMWGLAVAVVFASGCSATATTVEQTTTPALEESVTQETATQEPAPREADPEPEPEPTPEPDVPEPEPEPDVPEPTPEPDVPEPEPTPEPSTPTNDQVWTSCPGGECTTVTVPLDYDDPFGATIEVAVVRTPAVNPDERIGSLFVNFGGPGGETTSIMGGAGPILAQQFERFDIVGWDPRGIGQTARLSCDALGTDFPTVELDPSDGFDDELAEQADEFADVVACAAESGDIIDHLGTANVARDMEQVRIALGDEPMNYLGLSYGTQIGWVYATLYGDSVRSMILDGAVPGGAISADDFADQLAAFQRTFDYFDDVCSRESECLQSNEGLKVAVERIADELEQQPVELIDGSLFGGAEFRQAVLFAMYQRPDSVGPVLTNWIDDADNGDVSGLLRLLDAGASSATPGGYQAVLCADGGAFPSSAGQVADFETTLAASESFGILGEVVRCDLWPGETDELPEIDSSAAPTILVVGSTLDPATPYESAVLLDQQLADSVLLTIEGGGHTAVIDDPCAARIAVAYVNDLDVPPADTVCFTPGLFGVELSQVVGTTDQVQITRVVLGSAADQAGVQERDVVVAVDGTIMSVPSDIPAIRPDTPSEWTLLRDGEEIGLAIRPTLRPWN